MTALIAKPLGLLRLDSIRSKILVFAVLAASIPSGTTAWISYLQNRRALTEKLDQELQSVSAQTAREMEVWLKERLYDLRVFATSYEVSENLDRAVRGGSPTRGRLNDYLNSVRDRFTDYRELLVLDAQGRVVATSAQTVRPVSLPPDWLKRLRTENALIGAASWDQALDEAVLVLAVPVQRAGGQIVGALAARLNLLTVQDVLAALAPDTTHRILLLTDSGSVIVSSRASTAALMRTSFKPALMERLGARPDATVRYTSFDGRAVAGSLKPVSRVPWVAVAEVSEATAYAQVRRFRNLTLLLVTALLVVVGGVGYRLGLLVVRPLDRLTKGAAEVAGGDLDVDLPLADDGGGEVGYLTYVFNHMVSRIREGRHQLDGINEQLRKQNEELERLSTTDALTGLVNRRHLLQRLSEEVLRVQRHQRPFAILMGDVDHFKEYNDTFGHPAGDAVLVKIAGVLRASIRSVDCPARYGGEEFLILLPETNSEGAREVAERIRTRVAKENFEGRPMTMSLGAALFPEHGSTAEAVIAAADGALYQAKREGRNRVVRAGGQGPIAVAASPTDVVPVPAPPGPIAPATPPSRPTPPTPAATKRPATARGKKRKQ